MSPTDPPPAGPAVTPVWLRVVFGLMAAGMTVQWFGRLSRVRGGEVEGGRLVWDVIALGLLPLAAGYCAYRAAAPASR